MVTANKKTNFQFIRFGNYFNSNEMVRIDCSTVNKYVLFSPHIIFVYYEYFIYKGLKTNNLELG